jgi:hypothetical protein
MNEGKLVLRHTPLGVIPHLVENPLYIKETQFRQVEPRLVGIAFWGVRIRRAVAHRPVLVTDAG